MSTTTVDSIQSIKEESAYEIAERIIKIGPRDENTYHPLQIDICLHDRDRAFRKYQFLFDQVGGHMLLFNIEGRFHDSPIEKAASEGINPETMTKEFTKRVEQLSFEEIDLFSEVKRALGHCASDLSQDDWRLWEGRSVDQDGNSLITTSFGLVVPSGDDQGLVGINAVVCARNSSLEELMGIKTAFCKMLEGKEK